jgi:uncharacterized SAM-binding protein YcdF (DUF218 family)
MELTLAWLTILGIFSAMILFAGIGTYVISVCFYAKNFLKSLAIAALLAALVLIGIYQLQSWVILSIGKSEVITWVN